MLNSLVEILRNVTRHKLRSFLTISGIVIGVLALTTMGALAENFNALIDGGVKYFGGSIQVGPPDGAAANFLPMSKVDEIKKVDGVAAAFPSYQFSAKPGGNFVVSFGIPDTIVAGDPDENNYSALKLTYAQGRAATASSRGEVALGSTIAKEFKKKVCDTIDLPVKPADAKPDFVNHKFTVVGILNETKTAPDTFAYINLTDGQMLLRDSLPAALLALIIGGLSVVNTMFMSVAERVREIGLKKAVGATTRNIMGEFLVEATLIGLIGGVVGYGLGVGVVVLRNTFFAPADGSSLFLITPALTIFAIGFATALGAVAGVLPAWRAARLDPVIALRNE